MAIASVGSFGIGASGTSGTTLVFSPTAQLDAGNLAVLVIAADNVGTTDADFSEVLSVQDSVGNWWRKVGEFTNGQTAAAAGVTCSIWMTRATVTLTTGGTVTVTFSNAIIDKCCSGWEFTVGANVGVYGKNQNATDGSAGFGSLTVGSLASRSYLFLRGFGKEANSTTALTVTTNYTTMTATRSRNNAAAILVRGEFRIVTATTETSNPTMAVTGDTASVMVALGESSEQTFSDNINA